MFTALLVALIAAALTTTGTQSRRRLKRLHGTPRTVPWRRRRRKRERGDTPIPSPLLLELLAALMESGAPPTTALRHIGAALTRADDHRATLLDTLAGALEQGLVVPPPPDTDPARPRRRAPASVRRPSRRQSQHLNSPAGMADAGTVTAGATADTARAVANTASAVANTAGAVANTAGAVANTAGAVANTAGAVAKTAGASARMPGAGAYMGAADASTAVARADAAGAVRNTAGAVVDAAGLGALHDVLRMATTAGLPPAALVRRAAAEERRRATAARQRAIRRLEVLLVLPVGLCLLPAFVLLGVVPVILDLLTG